MNRRVQPGVLILFAALVLPLASARVRGDDTPGPISQKMQPYVDDHAMAGMVGEVATRNRVLDQEAVGYADLETKSPMKADTVFWIASQGKAMTCAVLMMLVDEGKVSVDDPVTKYLPEFEGQKVNEGGKLVDLVRPIEIRDLLTHTSGLPFASPSESPTLDVGSLEDRVRSYAKLALNSQPGVKFSYANAGINTAGRIIEVITGEPFDQVMKERLFQPLGMNDTTFFPNQDQLSRLAVSYKASPDGQTEVPTVIGQLHYPLDSAGRYAVPAGGLFSTAGDVTAFCQMILNDGVYQGTRYLSHHSVEEMTTDQIPASTGGSYGFGWMIPPGYFYHDGAYQTDMIVEPSLGLAEIFMVQQAGPFANHAPDLKSVFRDAAHEAAKEKQ